jgi:hypothetical protein
MSSLAVRFFAVNHPYSPACHVFVLRYGLKVRRVHAMANAAQVINL